ncbi:MAG: AbiV family abortive infection protein [Acidobacteria bacterium]|nr:AbiV family abortive infection protein [Acidobacteriota bacterium]
MELTPGYLCRGTFLAAEQAWHLLHDANLLYGQKRYANSLVLSVYSVEEVGRSRIYLESTKQVLQGKVITLEDLRKRCRDHMEKLAQGRSPEMIHVAAFIPPEFPAPGSPEESKFAQHWQELRKAREAAAPRKTHAERLQALYVDPIDGEGEWNVPSNIEEFDALDMLYVAGYEYEKHRTKLNRLLQDRTEFQQIASRVPLPNLPETICFPDWKL